MFQEVIDLEFSLCQRQLPALALISQCSLPRPDGGCNWELPPPGPGGLWGLPSAPKVTPPSLSHLSASACPGPSLGSPATHRWGKGLGCLPSAGRPGTISCPSAREPRRNLPPSQRGTFGPSLLRIRAVFAADPLSDLCPFKV